MKLITLFVLLLSSINLGQIGEQTESMSMMAKVHVNYPNFKVLSENGYETFTVIKDAPIPNNFEGSLLQLSSDDLNDLQRVFQNLNTKKVIIYEQDEKIALALENLGFNTTIIDTPHPKSS